MRRPTANAGPQSVSPKSVAFDPDALWLVVFDPEAVWLTAPNPAAPYTMGRRSAGWSRATSSRALPARSCTELETGEAHGPPAAHAMPTEDVRLTPWLAPYAAEN
jgi:hypothetical protein